MARRYINDARIYITYNGMSDAYEGSIVVTDSDGKRLSWKFDALRAPRCGFDYASDSPKAYDKMAATAVSFGSYYTSYNRGGDTPEWAPSADFADALEAETCGATDDQGNYSVSRKRREDPLAEARKNALYLDSVVAAALRDE